jgi:rubredoxin
MNPYLQQILHDITTRLEALEEALAKQEQELALQKLHDENDRLGLYKDAYGEEYKESVRLQCVVCNTVYAEGIPPQVAKQEQGEPRFWQGISDNPYCNDADSNEPNSRAMRWHNKLLSLDENQQPKQEQSEHWGHGGRPMTLRECMEAEEPQQRTWVGLTIEEREQIQQECFGKVPHHVAFAHAIEAKLKEKNNA